ncbi:hypothetical protein [Bradyrhizobium sp. AUGA SZCCT0182]|uniref:hypothetical protein n=1 Tax=Bradyrhizobium sp. AUGA SZCCT0182 TaxID=2807667 RepID=UPI001BAD511D|nr:hypothetical protein [Bradyrhizobium sp. AUGA SZCCT0182]MBR1232855.1 hypothetical protein [Bradyrhizobium sp. AUGA SZCCT0182]
MAKVERLAHRLAGKSKNEIVCAFAREAAEANLELARVRRVKVGLIERASAFGALVPPKHFRCQMQEVRWCIQMDLWFRGLRATRPPQPLAIDPLDSMPVGEPDQLAEAARRVLGELVRLDRYERRAASRRHRAIRAMLKAKTEDPLGAS